MVSLLVVSHSNKIAEGVKELAKEMAPEVRIAAVGGTVEGRLGSDYDKINNALSQIYTSEGVIVLFDLGSSYMTTEMVKEAMALEGKGSIYIADAPLVEGTVTAAVQASLGRNIEQIKEYLTGLKMGKI